LPLAFSERVPVSWAEDEKWYVPGGRTIPPRSCPVRSLVGGKATAALYAFNASAWAAAAAEVPACMFPLSMPGGNPVIAVPGETPRSPLMIVIPVLVTVVAPRTPKVAADPRLSCALIRPGKARLQAMRA